MDIGTLDDSITESRDGARYVLQVLGPALGGYDYLLKVAGLDRSCAE